MRSSERARAIAFAVGLFAASLALKGARAQQQTRGFGVERFYASAPGGGWLVMDSLERSEGLRGTVEMTAGYARNPLRLTSAEGSQRLAVVSEQAFVLFGFAVDYERFRFYANLQMPLLLRGQSGAAFGYVFAAPDLDLGSHPDTFADARFGADVLLFGTPDGALRLGAGAQLFIPNGERDDYQTDDTYRAMGRVLVAGDLGPFTYAGHLGAHLRLRDDGPTPSAPQGSELLFGVAAGPRLSLRPNLVAIVGPELYGETALRHAFAGPTTGLEWLMTGRLEHSLPDRQLLRGRVGLGSGLNAHFGAPEWRAIMSLEMSGRTK